jgi:hypothetical protein
VGRGIGGRGLLRVPCPDSPDDNGCYEESEAPEAEASLWSGGYVVQFLSRMIVSTTGTVWMTTALPGAMSSGSLAPWPIK